jgi:hypothetical protein
MALHSSIVIKTPSPDKPNKPGKYFLLLPFFLWYIWYFLLALSQEYPIMYVINAYERRTFMKNTLLRKALTTSGVTLALIPLVLAANATLFQVSAVRFIGPPVPVTPPITPVTPPQASPSLSLKNKITKLHEKGLQH